MLYTVEVRHTGAGLATAMAEMRTWLDHHRIEPDWFHHVSGARVVAFHASFKREDDALAFAKAFGGRLVEAVTPVQAVPKGAAPGR